MTAPILITGFGPFGKVDENGSQRLVEDLLARPPAGLALVGGVLPVEFGRVGAALDELLRGPGRGARALVATGVHRAESLRIERRARRLGGEGSERTDNVGRRADDEPLEAGLPDELATTVDLETLRVKAQGAGDLEAWISDDAGGYVCERACFHTLLRGRELGLPALFVHVPPLELCSTGRLRAPFEALLRALD
ncbi:hypothetical protein [Engelhardtia mirabilis]|uniref:Pyrrolidone-carboxylate peptidase n=1 Tax=Engelhardtia mirabilis TaxID=2528011 RepID=A0A518BQV9_9BACT|nr:Pyrrolidone-carboxylate peptidase [Planctomycetes bacterium Pla133]QDV03688.1 Pyrrolidone-carboxylate peptidase [Planctomycetes bacterium Pla86]